MLIECKFIQDNEDGSVTVTYQPRESGNHILSMQHDGVDMAGSPISFYVSETGDGYVTVYGTGLSHAVVGEPAPFTVCAKGSPSRELSVAVEGTAKATIKCHDNKVLLFVVMLGFVGDGKHGCARGPSSSF